MYEKYLKRILDFILALMGILISIPFLLLILPVSAVVYKSNPFFLQERSGKSGKSFYLLKLRTMNENKDEAGNLLTDMQRINPWGNFLRATSLDEIPNLWNVFRGDMSLVGPRPLLPEYLPFYSPEQNRRHEVLPGITGWAQVNGRNSISWKEKFELDVWYTDHLSFRLDMKIIGLTFVRLFKKKGINASKEETMEYFRGDNYNQLL